MLTRSVSRFLRETARDPEKRWTVIDSLVVDLAAFSSRHPGGARVLEGYVGRDATQAFYDGVLNRHSRAARSLVDMLAIARVVPDN